MAWMYWCSWCRSTVRYLDLAPSLCFELILIEKRKLSIRVIVKLQRECLGIKNSERIFASCLIMPPSLWLFLVLEFPLSGIEVHLCVPAESPNRASAEFLLVTSVNVSLDLSCFCQQSNKPLSKSTGTIHKLIQPLTFPHSGTQREIVANISIVDTAIWWYSSDPPTPLFFVLENICYIPLWCYFLVHFIPSQIYDY